MKLRCKIYALLIALLAIPLQQKAQEVINTAGGDRQLGSSGIFISDNVGEAFIQTFGPAVNIMINEGYLQPIYIPKVIIPDPKASYTVSGLTNKIKCKDNFSDAFVKVEIETSATSYTPTYIWTPSNLCANNNCSKIDSLSPGNYSVKVILQSFNRLGVARIDTTVDLSFEMVNSDINCQVTIYSGVTPNNDGVNETWQIDDIDKYPNNEVTIYNRWGYEIFKTKSYNNRSNSWPPKDELNKLPSSTYFYIIELGDGSKPIKGWVELIKD